MSISHWGIFPGCYWMSTRDWSVFWDGMSWDRWCEQEFKQGRLA